MKTVKVQSTVIDTATCPSVDCLHRSVVTKRELKVGVMMCTRCGTLFKICKE